MSVLINANLLIVRPYTEKEAAEALLLNSGFRLSVIRWRETEKKLAAGEKTHATMCVLVEEIPLEITKPKLLHDALRRSLDKLQDDRIKAVCEAWLANGGQLTALRLIPEEINESGIRTWSDQETSGGRLSGDLIQQWFDSVLKDHLAAKFLANGASEDKATKACNGYAATFKKLASPATPMNVDILTKLTDAMGLVPASSKSRVDEQLASAITRRLPKDEADMLMEL